MDEIVIAFNGSTHSFRSYVFKQINHHKVKYINLKKPNLSLALEKGIQKATNDWVLLMDSDCTFKKGAIEAFKKSITEKKALYEVYKGRVVFKESERFISKIIARSRQHHTAEQLTAYKPPLAFSKKINSKIGGYFFDKRLIWREDADLDNRIRQAKITIKYVPRGVIYHETISMKTDLRSTFRYGMGEAIAKRLNIKLTNVPRSIISTYKSQGIFPALYMIFRNRVYTTGFLTMKWKIMIKQYEL